MKKKDFLKLPLYMAMGVAMSLNFAACSDDDNSNPNPNPEELSEQEQALKLVIEDYVNKSVVPTYSGLADACIDLADLCREMCNAGTSGLTADLITQAGEKWIEARRYWELSEAWLYGAAADYNIDPHIDTWPLDKVQMENMLNNPGMMAQMADEEKAASYVSNNLGIGLLGFHAIEYMLFEPANASTDVTSPRPASKFTQNELYYLAAVADDLRNQAIRLEVSWADEGTFSESSEKWQYLAAAELEPTKYYGEAMKNAGQAGSWYHSYAEAAQELLVGAQDIADEVGGQKIGNPIGNGEENDPDYIESPYALNSIVDFIDNLRSVRTAYMGYQPVEGVTETYIQPVEHSLSDYIKTVDPDLDTRVINTLNEAIEKIGLMQEPFASTARDPQFNQINLDAQEACQAVNDILDEVMNAIQNNE